MSAARIRDSMLLPWSGEMATPIDAPDFAASFGLQVSVIAQDGVERAELHQQAAALDEGAEPPKELAAASAASEAAAEPGGPLGDTRSLVPRSPAITRAKPLGGGPSPPTHGRSRGAEGGRAAPPPTRHRTGDAGPARSKDAGATP